MNKFFKNHAGVSLIIAIIFVSLLMLAGADLARVSMGIYENIRNRRLSGQTYYFSQGVLETASYWAGKNNEGQNTDDYDFAADPLLKNQLNSLIDAAKGLLAGTNCEDTDGNSANGLSPCVGFRVVGRTAGDAQNDARVKINDTDTSYYVSPLALKEDGVLKGTGTAEEECSNPNDANDACHWNRIAFGDNIEIPLYYKLPNYKLPNGSISDHDYTNGGAQFLLRVRTPCKDSTQTNCAASDRIILYPSVGTDIGYLDINEDDVLIQWIVEDQADTKRNLIANSRVGDGKRFMPTKDEKDENNVLVAQNTQLSAGRINLANSDNSIESFPYDILDDYTVLKYIAGSQNEVDKHRGLDLTNVDQPGAELIGKMDGTPIGEFIKNSEKPFLRLNMIDIARKADDKTPVTYLEYQLLSTIPIADTKTFLTGFSEFGDFRKTMYGKRTRHPHKGGFAFENPY